MQFFLLILVLFASTGQKGANAYQWVFLKIFFVQFCILITLYVTNKK